jgi:hypothetical protein
VVARVVVVLIARTVSPTRDCPIWGPKGDSRNPLPRIGFVVLDRPLARLHANKPELLRVLAALSSRCTPTDRGTTSAPRSPGARSAAEPPFSKRCHHSVFRYSRSAFFSAGDSCVPYSWPQRLLPELRSLQSVVVKVKLNCVCSAARPTFSVS